MFLSNILLSWNIHLADLYIYTYIKQQITMIMSHVGLIYRTVR